MEVDELVMVQVVHDVNLFPDLGQRSGHLHKSILLAFYNLLSMQCKVCFLQTSNQGLRQLFSAVSWVPHA